MICYLILYIIMQNQQINKQAQNLGIISYKFVEPYIVNLDKLLGKGAYGQVYLAVDTRTSIVRACKQLSKQTIQKQSANTIQYLDSQIDIMRKLFHPNLVKLYDIRKSKKNIYLFMQNCDEGSLDSYLRQNGGKLSEKQSIQIFAQILSGYQKLFNQKIVHRDLKPANILIRQGNFKIADFGFSKIINDHQNVILTHVGTPLYMCPQILHSKTYTSKADIWSLGIIFFQMLNGKSPFPARNIQQLKKMISERKIVFNVKVSKSVQKLIESMLMIQEKDRIEFSDLFQHNLFIKLKLSPQQNLNQSIRIVQQKNIKDTLYKSNKLNNNYFAQNKVIKKIVENKETLNVKDCITENQEEYNQQTYQTNQNKIKYQKAIEQYDKKKKENQIIRKIESWVLHRRNKAVFLNHITLKLVQLLQQNQEKLDKKMLERSSFLLSKYQIMIVYKMYHRLKEKKLDVDNKKFTQKEYDLFMKDQKVNEIYKNLKQDFKVMKIMFEELINKVKIDPPQQFICLLNNNVTDNTTFKHIFNREMQKLVQHLIECKQIIQNDELQISIIYIETLLKSKFKFGTDWNKIYEQIQQKIHEE